MGRRFSTSAGAESGVREAADVRRAQAFRRTLHFKLNLFSVPKTFVPAEAFDVVAVDEDVLAAITRLDEAKAFLGVEPLYSSLLHNVLCLLSCQTVAYQTRRTTAPYWSNITLTKTGTCCC